MVSPYDFIYPVTFLMAGVLKVFPGGLRVPRWSEQSEDGTNIELHCI